MSIAAQKEQLAREVCRTLQSVLLDNLYSCALYGSVVRGNTVSSTSDINLLIVLHCSTPEAHRVVANCLQRFKGINPFVLARAELPGSQRMFAIKFRSIQRHYVVLCGEDPLADFDPPAELLRFLSEQSLRNLRLRLKRAYITIGHDGTPYARRLAGMVPALFTTLSEVLRCAGIEIPNHYQERTSLIGHHFRVNAQVLDDLLSLKRSPHALSADEAFSFHSRLFKLLCQAIHWVEEQWQQTMNLPRT